MAGANPIAISSCCAMPKRWRASKNPPSGDGRVLLQDLKFRLLFLTWEMAVLARLLTERCS